MLTRCLSYHIDSRPPLSGQSILPPFVQIGAWYIWFVTCGCLDVPLAVLLARGTGVAARDTVSVRGKNPPGTQPCLMAVMSSFSLTNIIAPDVTCASFLGVRADLILSLRLLIRACCLAFVSTSYWITLLLVIAAAARL